MSNAGVVYSTIQAFKGLESPAVVLVDLEPRADHDSDAMLYVGMTRARTRLVMLLPESARSEIARREPQQPYRFAVVMQTMSEIHRVRDHVMNSLRRELVGPDPGRPAVQWGGPGSPLNGEEILRPQDRPKMRYGAGILFPNGMTYSGLLDEVADRPASDAADGDTPDPESEDGSDDPAGDADDEVPVFNSFVPSSMGVSFLSDSRDGLVIEARWATYHPEHLEGYVGARDGADLWFRSPHIEEKTIAPAGDGPLQQCRKPLADGAGPALAIVDRPWAGGMRLYTVTLINTRSAARIEDTDCFFQCGLTIRPQGKSRICPYPSPPDADLDPEERSLKLLYRHRPTFAVGHGCAADWTEADGLVTDVRTETLPLFTQHPILPRDALDGANLSMLDLSRAADSRCSRVLPCAFEAIQGLDPTAALGRRRRRACRRNSRRPPIGIWTTARRAFPAMLAGADVLESNVEAMTAFRWMNFAMVQQRSHYGLSADKEKRRAWVPGPSWVAVPERPFVNPEYPATVAWRPFPARLHPDEPAEHGRHHPGGPR